MTHLIPTRVSRRAEGALLAGVLGCLAGLLLMRLGVIRSARGVGFLMVFGTILLSNVYWWLWAGRWLGARAARGALVSGQAWLAGWLWTGYCLLMLSPVAFFMMGGRRYWDSLPVPVLSWTLTWHLLIGGFGSAAAVVVAGRCIARATRRGWGGAASGQNDRHEDNHKSTENAQHEGDERSTANGRHRGRPLHSNGDHSPIQESRPLETEGQAALEVGGSTGVSGGAAAGRGTDPSAYEKPGTSPLLTRRALLGRATAAAPLVITGAFTLSGLRQEGQFLEREITLEVPGLPDRLKGLTITHISDFHVGRFFRPEHLPRVVDAAHRMKGDIVAITGDILDHSSEYLPATQEALAQIEAPYGRYLVIGNHDLFDGPREVVRYLSEREPHFLMDELVPVDVGGEIVQIAGLFWSRNEQPVGIDPGHAGRARRALGGADPDRFTIALAHHPHAFETLAAHGANLVLTGHTHGGQLMLTPSRSRFALGAGNLLFRYIHGVYAHGAARMYVNSGVGNWFPVRINAPAEIVKIRLT